MAVKPTSLRQLEERFVCQYRCSGDEATAPRDVQPRLQRVEPRSRRRTRPDARRR